MRIAYAPRALRDIDDILSYVHERSPRGAHALSLALEVVIHTCALYPRAGVATDEPHVYRWPLSRYPYAVFYREIAGGEGIEVVRVLHGAGLVDLRRAPDSD